MKASAGAALALSLGTLVACGAPAGRAAAPPEEPSTQRVSFALSTVDGASVLRSEALRGKPTILAFLATYDLASQAQARFLSMVARRHEAEIFAVAIVLEPPENRPLVLAFRDTLGLRYPVVFADEETMAGRGPFGDVRTVPMILLLDGEGRPAYRHIGLARDTEIEPALRDTLGRR